MWLRLYVFQLLLHEISWNTLKTYFVFNIFNYHVISRFFHAMHDQILNSYLHWNVSRNDFEIILMFYCRKNSMLILLSKTVLTKPHLSKSIFLWFSWMHRNNIALPSITLSIKNLSLSIVSLDQILVIDKIYWVLWNEFIFSLKAFRNNVIILKEVLAFFKKIMDSISS